MTKRKILIPILSAVMALFVAFGVLFATGTFNTASAGTTWTAGYGSTWTGNPETGEATTTGAAATNGDRDWNHNYYTAVTTTSNDYRVSVDLKTAQPVTDFPTGDTRSLIGLMPLIVENGDIVTNSIYIFLSVWDGKLAELGINDWDGTASTWKYVFTDQERFPTALGSAGRVYPITEYSNFAVERIGAAFHIYFNDIFVYTYTSTNANANLATTYAGVYTDGFTSASFKNFKFNQSNVTETITTTASVAYTAPVDTWAANGAGVIAKETKNGLADIATTDLTTASKKDYSLTVTGKANSSLAEGFGVAWGLVPFYKDPSNYITVSISWLNEGTIRSVTVTKCENGAITWPKESWSHLSDDALYQYASDKYDTSAELICTRISSSSGDTYTVSYKGTTMFSFTDTTFANQETAKVGLYAARGEVEFSALTAKNYSTVTYKVNGVENKTEKVADGNTITVSNAAGKAIVGANDAFIAWTVDGAVNTADTYVVNNNVVVDAIKLGMTPSVASVEVSNNRNATALNYTVQVNADDYAYAKTALGVDDTAFEFHTVLAKNAYFAGNYTLAGIQDKTHIDRVSALDGDKYDSKFVIYSYELATAVNVINYVNVTVGGKTITAENNGNLKTSAYAEIYDNEALQAANETLLKSIVRGGETGSQEIAEFRALYIGVKRIAFIDENGTLQVDAGYEVTYVGKQLEWSEKA